MYRYQKFVDLALENALKSPLKKRFGAVIIHQNKVVSQGHNIDTFRDMGERSCILRVLQVLDPC